jgi:ketosteroid isomerase-like protein
MPTVLGLTTDPSPHGLNSNSNTNTTPKPPPTTTKMGGKGRLDTISKRNHAAAIEIETLFWRALCDSPEAAKEYMAEDCVMINPLFAGSAEPMSKTTEPSIDDILEGAEPWSSYRMHGTPEVVEIDLMAVAVLYRITLYKQPKKGGAIEEVEATVSSSWRQVAGGDWVLVAQHCA